MKENQNIEVNNTETTENIIPNYKLFNKSFISHKKPKCPLADVDNSLIDYKNPELLKKYISEKGKILPSRITNVSAPKQRLLTNAIKVARHVSLLPYTTKK